jgi:hypothetical protein
LENKVVELGIVDRASDSTIGRALKKTLILIDEIAAWEHDRNANHTKAD